MSKLRFAILLALDRSYTLCLFTVTTHNCPFSQQTVLSIQLSLDVPRNEDLRENVT